ncbi:MAG: very short patch repair endonuclease [bacterium]
MTDVHDDRTRSYNMSQIKGKNTKPEMIVRRFLHKNGFRYKLHDKTLPGKPDIVLPKYKTVIFVNGCFWHGHKNCKYFVLPKTNTEWWENKIIQTKLRDIEKINKLKGLGWTVITIWECEIKKQNTNNILKKTAEIIISKTKCDS